MVDVGSPAHTTAIAEPQALCMCTGIIISVFVTKCPIQVQDLGAHELCMDIIATCL